MYDDDDAETGEAGPSKEVADDDSGDTEALLRKLRRWEQLARDHWSKWREEARECYDFVAGRQWSSDDKAKLMEEFRQPVTFNRIAPMVDAVTGAEILNRQEVHFAPVEQGDVQISEIIGGADKWAREQADTEDEESDAFYDLVVCGMGWTETRMDYADNPEGMVYDDRVDPLEMWSDPSAKKRCVADANFLIRARWRDKSDLPKAWRGKIDAASDSDGGPGIDDPSSDWNSPRDDYERDDDAAKASQAQANKKRVWVRHIQWREKEPAWRLADEASGKAITVDKEKLREIGRMFLENGMRPPEAVKIEVYKYYEAILIGGEIMEHGPIDAQGFTFKCITGKRDRNTNTFYGVVRAMIDPQMWGNKFFVQIMHILNTSAKGGLLYEKDAFTNPAKAIADWSKPNEPIELKGGALSGPNPKVKEREQRVFPVGTDKMMEFSLNNLPQTSGINLELLGLVEREQPGVLEAQRKKAGYAILAVFFDSLRRYRKMKGRLRLHFIQHYMSDGRLIRIKGRDSKDKYVPLVRDPNVGTYDVTVDEAPMSPNQKEAVWGMLMAMMPLLAKLSVPPEVWSVIIEYSPLPSAVSGKINEILAEARKQPPPPDPKIEAIKAQAQLQQQRFGLEAAQQQQQAQIDAQEAAREDQQAQQEIVQQQQEATLATAQREAELHAQLEELQIKRELAEIDIRKAQTKAVIDIATARAKQQAASRPKANA